MQLRYYSNSSRTYHFEKFVTNLLKVVGAIEVPFQCLHNQLLVENLAMVQTPSEVAHKMNKVPQTKILAELWLGHEVGVGVAEFHNHLQISLELRRRVVGSGAETALGQCLQVLI